MILVPLEDLAETILWSGEVYAPHPEGKGQLPPDLIAHLQNQTMVVESDPKQSYVAVRPGVINCDVIWGGRIYSSRGEGTEDLPQEMLEWLVTSRPDLLAMDALAALKQEDAPPPDGSRLELKQSDLIAEMVEPGSLPTIPDGVVDDSGHAGIGDLPVDDEEIIIDVGTQFITA